MEFSQTVGWSDLHFLRFSKMGTLLSIAYIFMSSIPKDRRSFHFQKITGTLKIYIVFENLQQPSLYIKEHLSKRIFKIKMCLVFLVIFQKWRKRFLT